jgi:lactoylglutathione lyase
MRYLHTMVRITSLDDSLDFYCNKLGLVEVKRSEHPEGRYTLVFLATPHDLYSKQLDCRLGVEKRAPGVYTSVHEDASNEDNNAENSRAKGISKDLHEAPMIELTYNWDGQTYSEGRNFGHLAFSVDNIYEICQKLQEAGVTINRPPRDGYMAFIRSPDHISIELLQKEKPLAPQEPWLSMPNSGIF